MKVQKEKVKKPIIYYIDISRHLSYHLIGPDHSDKHRKMFGIIIMLVSVSLKTLFIEHGFVASVIADIIGSSMHGIGLIPFISGLEEKSKNINKEKVK